MKLEYEVRILNHAAELLENLVNRAVCSYTKNESKTISTVFPNDEIAKKLFFILLLELFLPVHQEIIPEKSKGDSLLTLLKKISVTPQMLEGSAKIDTLKNATEEYINWLAYKFDCELYSANIDLNLSIKLSREEALYLVGNRCKHTLLRSNTIVKRLVKIYQESGAVLNPGSELLILEDIDSWFFDHFGGYHFTKLCELSSNIYYGIVEYVQPVRLARIEWENDTFYSYRIPPSLSKFESQSEFYDLLNRVHNPYVPKINTDKYLQLRY